MTIKVKTTLVTPEMAKKWFEARAKNRPISVLRVAQYVQLLKQGSWRFTHQGFAFDCDGVLVDGQHRAKAIWESGVSVMMLLITYSLKGVELEYALRATDIGRVRTAADQLHIQATLLTNYTMIAAASRIICLSEMRSKMSRDQILDLAKAEQPALSWAVQWRKGAGFRASHTAALALAYPINNAKVEEFAVAFTTGEELSKGSPILQLRSRKVPSATEEARVKEFRVTLRAIQLFVSAKAQSKLIDSRDGIDWCRAERAKLGLTMISGPADPETEAS